MKRAKYSIDQLRDAVQSSISKREVLRRLGLVEAGGNYATITRYIKTNCIDTSHWLGKGHLKGKSHNWAKKRSLQEILVEDSPAVCTNSLRLRLLREGLFERKCYAKGCGLKIWKGQPIALELEHINGCRTDNRRENLTLLCPNCHAQTSTYRGKNKKNK